MNKEERLVNEIQGLLLRLRDADILAMTVDVLVQRGALDPRSLIGDARLIYGEPWKYEYASKKVLLGYKGGIEEVIKILSEKQ